MNKKEVKKEKQIKVDYDFLMKIANKLNDMNKGFDDLKREMESLKVLKSDNKPKDAAPERMDFKIAVNGPGVTPQNVNVIQKEFVTKLWMLIKSYQVTEFSANYKK